MLTKIIPFINSRKKRRLFYSSPFIVIFICFIASVILIELNLPGITENMALIPLGVGIGYFILWLFLITSTFIFHGKFVPTGQIKFNNLFDEVRKNKWNILKETKALNGEISFKINGFENKTEFLLERTKPFPEEAFYTTAVYIKSVEAENYDVFLEDIGKNIKNKSKSEFINKAKVDLIWLMEKNNFITEISFHNGSMGAIVNDTINFSPYLKEIIIRLVEITKVYNRL